MRRRLFLVTLAVTSLLVAAFAVPLAILVRDVARDRAITDAERDESALAPVLASDPDHATLDAAIQLTASGAAGRLSVVLPDGARLGDATPIDADDLALAREGNAFSRRTDAGVEVFLPVVVDRDGPVVLRVRVPQSALTDGVAASWTVLAILALGLLAVSVVATDRLARSVTRPAAELAATSRRLAAGEATARASGSGPPEIAAVAESLNLLADRIDELLAAERERVADLSHRLRTPLTALRLAAEGRGDPAMVEGVDRLEAEVSELIRAARRPLHRSVALRADLVTVARERADFWGALAEDDGRTWSCTLPPTGSAIVRLSTEDARAAVDVLLGNVFAHTEEGVAYAVSVDVDGPRVRLTVDDAGPGVPDVASGVVARGSSGGASTGLGLDIAAATAREAGGQLQLTRSPLGGTRVVLDLPVVDGQLP